MVYWWIFIQPYHSQLKYYNYIKAKKKNKEASTQSLIHGWVKKSLWMASYPYVSQLLISIIIIVLLLSYSGTKRFCVNKTLQWDWLHSKTHPFIMTVDNTLITAEHPKQRGS